MSLFAPFTAPTPSSYRTSENDTARRPGGAFGRRRMRHAPAARLLAHRSRSSRSSWESCIRVPTGSACAPSRKCVRAHRGPRATRRRSHTGPFRQSEYGVVPQGSHPTRARARPRGRKATLGAASREHRSHSHVRSENRPRPSRAIRPPRPLERFAPLAAPAPDDAASPLRSITRGTTPSRVESSIRSAPSRRRSRARSTRAPSARRSLPSRSG